MGYGNTALDSYEYDEWLAKNKKEKELRQRKMDRFFAHKKDLSGYHFGIADKPVYVKNVDEFRKELSKRGLAIEGEYTGKGR